MWTILQNNSLGTLKNCEDQGTKERVKNSQIGSMYRDTKTNCNVGSWERKSILL